MKSKTARHSKGRNASEEGASLDDKAFAYHLTLLGCQKADRPKHYWEIKFLLVKKTFAQVGLFIMPI
jgi:hypothetical protein